jgi:hypothetical protein
LEQNPKERTFFFMVGRKKPKSLSNGAITRCSLGEPKKEGKEKLSRTSVNLPLPPPRTPAIHHPA